MVTVTTGWRGSVGRGVSLDNRKDGRKQASNRPFTASRYLGKLTIFIENAEMI